MTGNFLYSNLISNSRYLSESETLSRKVVQKTDQHVIQHLTEQTLTPGKTNVRIDKPIQQLKETENNLDRLSTLSEGSIVYHKKFGEGRVVKIINNEKFIHVKFTIGEKKFVYPDAFIMGFLEVK